MVFELLAFLLLLRLHPGSSDRYKFVLRDTTIDAVTPLQVPVYYSHLAQFYLINVTIWNSTADTYKFLNNRIKIFDLSDCFIAEDFFLPLIEKVIITDCVISEIIIHDDNNITKRLVATNASLRSIPTNIDRLAQLQEIKWKANEIETFDFSVLSGLKNLKYVTFMACSISKVTDRKAVQLPLLVSLELGYNKISHINTEQWITPELSILNLENNQLSQLPLLKQFLKLHTLSVENNLISSINQNELSTLKILSILHLSNNRLSQLDSWVSIQLPKLSLLDLNRNRLESLDVSQWQLPKLRKFSIEHNQLRTIEGFESIAGTLQTFDFAGNPWNCEWVHFAVVDLSGPLRAEWTNSCGI